MKEEIIIKGMHCASCEKTITRALEREGVTVESISHKDGRANISHNTTKKNIHKILTKKGYALEGEKIAKHIRIEKKVLLNGALALGVLLAVQIALLLLIYNQFAEYTNRYFLPLLYLPIAIVTNMVALWHQRAYNKEVSCMTGMMVGMTIGMTTGFTIGAIVGLINGMFVGSLVGTLVGIIAGVYAGKCCGTMGMMEGMMAGLMSGTMGAMLTVMMIADHVEIFLPILLVICTVILAGLMRVTAEESGDSEATPWPLSVVLGISLIAMITISIIILLGPKGFY